MSAAALAPGLTLREAVEERRTLDGFLAEEGGELTPEIEALLVDVTATLEEKTERVARYILSERARIEALRTEEQRLADRRKAKENRLDWLEHTFLREQLNALGVDVLNGTYCTVRLQANNPSITGTLDECALRSLAQYRPELVRVTPETYELDKRAALAAVKAGVDLPDGLAVERTLGVRIR